MQHLVDGDLASNQHGWQWTAGTGTDAAPYFRVFNPVTQGQKFDPDGDYVRRWVPELRGVAGKAVHEPWTLGDEPPAGYPEPIVDHATERKVALERYQHDRAAEPASERDDAPAAGPAAPGSRTISPAPVLNASGAQVIGSIATPGWPGVRSSTVNTCRYRNASSNQSRAPPAGVRTSATPRPSRRSAR